MPLKKPNISVGVRLIPDDVAMDGLEGELKVSTTTPRVKAYVEGATRDIVTVNQTQTLTGKTIDADDNTISDLQVANLKAGVLNTSTSLSGASNTQVPSALATKTYVDNGDAAVQTNVNNLVTLSGVATNATTLGIFTGSIIPDSSTVKAALQALETNDDAKDANVAALVSLSGVAANATNLGTFTGTTIPDNQNVKQALQSLETAGETTSSGLAAHIANTTGAHAASAITNTPAGTISATTVQAALNELDGDIAGKVTGPASATDNALATFDGTTGKLVKNSVVINNAGTLTGIVAATASGTIQAATTTSTAKIIGSESNDAATGSNATLTSPATPEIRLTAAGTLVSIDMIPAGTAGQIIILTNATNATVAVNNNTGATTANRILTGTATTLSLADEASLILKYDATEARWMVVGGSAAGSGVTAFARVVNSSAQSITNGTPVKLDWDNTATFSSNITWDSTNNRFTALYAGKYQVSTVLTLSKAWQAGQQANLRIYKNGSAVSQGPFVVSDAVANIERGLIVTDIIDLAVTDYIEIYAVVLNGTGNATLLANSQYNYASIFKIN